eukprot:jgi/Mesvir1/18579/Mv17088-RA.1
MSTLGTVNVHAMTFSADPVGKPHDNDVEITSIGEQLVMRTYDADVNDYVDAVDITRGEDGAGDFAFHSDVTVLGSLDVQGSLSIHGVPTAARHAVTVSYLKNDTISSLSEAPDVSITTPQNGQVLTYNAPTSKWVNAAPRTAVVSDAFQYTGPIVANASPSFMSLSTGGLACPQLPFGMDIHKVSLTAYDVPDTGDNTVHPFTVVVVWGETSSTVQIPAIQSVGSVNGKKIAFGSAAVDITVQEGHPVFVKIASTESYASVGIAVNLSGYTSLV